ncbi:hypothetical protein EB796_003338 [Bugula neritina]|uniref:Endoplasmic reticulum lectin 1 n=1 Tax=Bugula neritina TaxID=10212 RepID=A0A7J7KI40_BUGNE|nr:hypothetical protein EB796_003338 [Bugula neritina]
MDTIPFRISWNGPIDPSKLNEPDGDIITLPMVTKDKEKYHCRFSSEEDSIGNQKPAADEYDGPSAKEIIDGFSLKPFCSYRVEAYWTYELCHGKSLRQYHEGQDPHSEEGVIVHPEYLLGKFKQYQAEDEGNVMVLNGIKYPYFTVEYDDGTLCDLTNVPRQTLVHYICHESGNSDIIQIKETSTCEYTAVVITSKLCKHPNYRPPLESSRVISCHSLDGAPDKPKMHAEMERILYQRESTFSSSVKKAGRPMPSVTKSEQEATRTAIGKSEDDNFLKNFLSGDQCLQGGTGWWSFELCYGKTAMQYHLEKGKRVTNIVLGKWDSNEHHMWLAKHPQKKPKSLSNRKFITQYYSGGDVCDETKKPRSVEVKLKCSTSASSTSHAVAIYLLEPKLCEYILTVESAILCDLVKQANDDGLLTNL